MNFSVIIPSKNAENLVPCVEALRKCEPDARIIVVDDGLDLSRSDSEALYRCWVSDSDPIVRVGGIKPFIFARNCNLGIQAAGTDDIVLLNDDAILKTPRGLSMLAEFSAEHPEVGCVAPATNVTGQLMQHPMHRTPSGWRTVDTVPYVCVYIPRRVLDKVGLLDERYCLDYGCEDLDHTQAMKRAGLKVAVLYDVYVDHGSLRSTFRGDPLAPRSFAQNHALYRQKWGIR